MPLRFATENPYTKSVRAGEEYNQEKRLRDQRLRSGDQDYDIKAEQRPYDLRRVTADTEGAESTTRVKIGTEGSDIARSGSQATQAEADARRAGTLATGAEFELGEDQANAPNVRRRIGSEADSAGSNARRSETQAQESQFDYGQKQQMAPDVRRRSKADADSAEQGARAARGNADFVLNRRTYENFDKSMQALAQGNIELAKYYAQQNGQTIPDAVLADAELRQGMVNIWRDAKETFYPNQPRGQIDFAREAVKKMMDERGRLKYDPIKSLQTPGTGMAPQPPANTMGVQRAGARTAADADAVISGLNLSAADARLVAIARERSTQPPAYYGAEKTVDFEMMAALLAQGGKPEIAALYDPKYRQAPRLPPGAGIMAPRAPSPQPYGAPGGTPPYIPQTPGQPSQVPPGSMNMAPQSGRPATPPQLRGVSQLQWSDKNQVFRDAQTGTIYDGQGNRLR